LVLRSVAILLKPETPRKFDEAAGVATNKHWVFPLVFQIGYVRLKSCALRRWS